MGIRALMGVEPAFQRLMVYPDDVFIVSYPRSGNTWLRFIIGNLLYNDPMTFMNIDRRVPDIYRSNARELLSLSRPRYLKSHEPFCPRYPKVIYVVRDPRDVLLSYYHYEMRTRQIPDGWPIERFAADFMEGAVGDFGTWADHVASWLSTRSASSRFLLLRYEALLHDPVAVAGRIGPFLNLRIPNSALARAVERSRFGEMQMLEVKGGNAWREAKGSRKDIRFVRAGREKQWKEECPHEILMRMEEEWGEWMDRLDYGKCDAYQGGNEERKDELKA